MEENKTEAGTYKVGAKIHEFTHANRGDHYDEAELKYSFEW